MATVVIEARISPLTTGSIRAIITERHGQPNGAGDIRIATFHASRARWHQFRAILSAGTQAIGVPFVILGREERAR